MLRCRCAGLMHMQQQTVTQDLRQKCPFEHRAGPTDLSTLQPSRCPVMPSQPLPAPKCSRGKEDFGCFTSQCPATASRRRPGSTLTCVVAVSTVAESLAVTC